MILKSNKILILPMLFLIELFLGFNGKMIMLCGVPIRHILFLLTFLSLYGYMFYCVLKDKIKIFSIKNKKDSLIGNFKMLDISVAVFLISMLVSIFVIPCFTKTSFKMAFLEGLVSFLIISLYFPLMFIIKRKKLHFEDMDNFLFIIVTVLSVIHLILYIGQKNNSNFMEQAFAFWRGILHGNAITPVVLLGQLGYPRAIFTTSIFMIFGVYFFLKNINNLKLYHYILMAINVIGLLSTITKSIWLGVAVGFFVFCVLYVIVQIRNKNYKNIGKLAIVCVGLVVLIEVSDFLIFDRFITIRVSNSFVNTEISKNDKDNSDKKNKVDAEHYKWADIDREGAILSNNIKIEQSYRLMKKWTERPIFGFGYGSFIENYVRVSDNNDYRFSYEMQLPALIMKTGIVGVACWIFLVISLIVTMAKYWKKHYEAVFSYMFLIVAFAVSVQTNPFLLSFVGMSIILYLTVYCSYFDNIQKKVQDGE